MKSSYITPAVTLFDASGRFDLDGQAALYEHLIQNHMDGILVLGSIGEFFSLSLEEKRKLASFAIHSIAHRCKTIIGTASMQDEEVILFSNECIDAGADAVMIVPPYYFALDEASVYRYFHRLAHEIRGPLYIYNFPARTGYSISIRTILDLAAECPNIIGVKDTVSDMSHTRDLIKLVKRLRPDFEVYSGFDDNLAHNALCGGDGCIGGLSNVFPDICAAWVYALRSNDIIGIAKGQQIINELFDIYSIGPSFIPIIKEAARLRGFISSVRCSFPFPDVTETQREGIIKLLQSCADHDKLCFCQMKDGTKTHQNS